MRQVSIFGDDFETLDRLGVADDVVEVDRAVLFYPLRMKGRLVVTLRGAEEAGCISSATCHGSS